MGRVCQVSDPRFLLDTQILLWAVNLDERLAGRHREIIAAKQGLVISVASIWEIAIKQSIDKLRIDGDILGEIRSRDVDILRVTEHHVLGVRHLPFHHRDPFDRLLISQARIENLTILSSDSHFHRYEVPVV
jgi:PIN domain nuclease of toxin-antitoxin system